MKINVRLDLEALDSTDVEQIRVWRNDHRVWKWCRQNDLISDVDQTGWYERQSKDPTIRMYRVRLVLDELKKTVGVCGFTSLDFINRRAEFSLYISPQEHGKGLGTQALKVLLSHGFLNLGLYQIWGESFDGNPAIKIFESLGFKKDGTRREFYLRDGRLIDAHLYSITRDEWIQTQQQASPTSLSQPSSEPTSP